MNKWIMLILLTILLQGIVAVFIENKVFLVLLDGWLFTFFLFRYLFLQKNLSKIIESKHKDFFRTHASASKVGKQTLISESAFSNLVEIGGDVEIEDVITSFKISRTLLFVYFPIIVLKLVVMYLFF